MEEILASIRKIISDDQAIPLSTRPGREEPCEPPVRAADPEIDRMRPPPVSRPAIDLSGSFVSAPPQRPARVEPAKPQPVAEVREIGPRPAPAPAPVAPAAPAPAPRLVQKEEPQPLLSDQVDAVVASSFQVLNAARTLPTGQVIENVARELLRPMLKQWLDDNLPPLVERLVRAEIERIARGER